MRWFQTEYLLKGIYLGFLLALALRQASQTTPNPAAPWTLALSTLGGLILALILAAILKWRQGYRPRGRLLLFVLFVLLESPTLVYVGILGGTFLGSVLLSPGETDPLLLRLVGGGALLGVLFDVLRLLPDRRMRLGLSLALAVALVAGAVYVFGLVEGLEPLYPIADYTIVGIFLLLGLPFFYLLTFAGVEEESEVEIAAMCATLGVGLTLVTQETRQFRTVAFLLPVMLYFWYTLRALPWLRVFKFFLRGITHFAVGRYRPALLAFRRVLHYDPKNETALAAYWQVHTSIDFTQLTRDRELLALVDFNLCVERAGTLLSRGRPSPDRLEEAHRLLDLVLSQHPVMRPLVTYWRCIALTHEQRLEQAADELNWLLDPGPHNPRDGYRRAVLLAAWQLALYHGPESLRERTGQVQLTLPGRRMEAIAAVERHLADVPEDPEVLRFKRSLYESLSEAEFQAGCAAQGPPREFDYRHVGRLGLGMLEDAARWERACEYLRMSAPGLPALAPTIYAQIAIAYEKAGQMEEAVRYLELTRQAGLEVGLANLANQEKEYFFRAVKQLGEKAMAENRLDAALEHFNLYTDYERSGLETLRTIAQLYELKEDALAALRTVERALQFNAKDKDLLERKDKYYNSVTPDVLQANQEIAQKEFDVAYCLQKAETILAAQQLDLETMDWAERLIDLALVVQPERRQARVLKGRVCLRRGEVEEAARLLEGVRTPKPEKFASTEDEDFWYVSCQILGDLYLNNLGMPAEAIACLNDFRKSPKSGARTLHRLGQAYEQLGDVPKAVRYYEQVTAYEGNPLAYDAREALGRLGR